MGKFIGNLVTKKKRKKLNRAIADESQLQTDLSLEIAGLERESVAVQQTRANAQMVQERIQAAREARIRRAEILASAANANALTSTAVEGSLSSIYSQFAGSMGLQNVFAGYSKELSKLQTTVGEKQSDIISSQGRQTALGAKLQTQQEKAEMIGGAIDFGVGAISFFRGSGFSGGGGSSATKVVK